MASTYWYRGAAVRIAPLTNFFGVLTILIFSQLCYAQIQKQSVEVIYEDSSSSVKSEEVFAEPIEELFKNPALANGIASGSDAINRSIESLMDSLFYSALDNELKYDLTENSWFSLGLRRDLYSTQSGAYVVVDRMTLGPRYSKAIGEIAKLPITLGSDGSVEVLQIYLRTSGMRVAENSQQPFWRTALNNWLGLLPLASLMLPPSFNPNELYDPIKQLSTPFSFPLSIDTFYEMPMGSIRSYNVSGGISASLDFAGIQDSRTSALFKSIENIAGAAPYTLFMRGESRINVLRRDENTAWVGSSKLSKSGNTLNFSLGNKIFVFTGALAATAVDNKYSWVWQGVPGLFFPIESTYESALADVFDQVYRFDLRNPHAQEAYLSAVRGDFTLAHVKYRDSKENGIKTGVEFEFTRNQKRQEKTSQDGSNIAVFKSSRRKELRKSEIEITDQKGKFYVLEANDSILNKQWDVLVGEETQKLSQNLEIKVKKLVKKSAATSVSDPAAIIFDEQLEVEEFDEDKFFESPMDGTADDEVNIDPNEEDEEINKFYYVLSSEGEPLTMTMVYDIQDRYTTSVEYEAYLNDLRYVAFLPISDIPFIERRDQEEAIDKRRIGFFRNPDNDPVELHVPMTYLGRFGGKATISISTKELNVILGHTEDQMWAAFADVFEKDVTVWRDPKERETLAFQSQWWPAFFALPLRLVNVRSKNIDAIAEVFYRIEALQRLKKTTDPLEILDAAYDLFDTQYPKELMRTLLLLANRNNIPRKVSLLAQPKGGARHSIKQRFEKANGRVFTAGPPFPEAGRYARAKKTLAAFYLDQPRELQDRPLLRKVRIGTKKLPRNFKYAEEWSKEEQAKQNSIEHAFVKIAVENVNSLKQLQLYVRVEQAGKLKFGKFELSEQVLMLDAIKDKQSTLKTQGYEFYLSGPASKMSNFIYDSSVNSGDNFAVTLTASRDGVLWSDSKTFEYRLENGKLSKIE